MDLTWLGDLWQQQLLPILASRTQGSLYLAYVLAFAGVFWLLPGRALKEWALIIASVAFIYFYVDRLPNQAQGSHFASIFMVSVMAVLYLVTWKGKVSLPLAGFITAGIWLLYWWMLPGGLLALLMKTPREWWPYLVKVFGGSSLLGPGQKIFFSVFLPIRAVSYLWDVALGRTQPRGLRSLLAWALFFPTVFCAPFIWHEPFMQQSEKLTRPPLAAAARSLGRMVLGYAIVTLAFAWVRVYPVQRFFSPQGYSPAEMWVTGYGWLIHFYLMAAGFADLNIGMAGLLGYQVPENFSRPLRRASMLEFWRSWNIMVAEFLKNYVYIPLGGSRKGIRRTHANYLLTMFACGLWHGFSPVFMLWGLLQGISLSVNRWWRDRLGERVLARLGAWPVRLLGWLAVIHFVTLTFTLLYTGSNGRTFAQSLDVMLRMLALR